jgi:hypothetical protein
MTYKLLFAAVATLLLAGAVFGQAGWLAPPPFEVQRDIFWSFDPGSQPPLYDPVYSGPDDPCLKDSDMIMGGNYSLLEFGALGLINNDPYPTGGMIRVQIDNWDRLNAVKLIWVQVDLYASPDSVLAFHVSNYDNTEVPWDLVDLVTNPDGSVTLLAYSEIRPNPPLEYLDFAYGPVQGNGGMVWIDNLHVATACVPEPGLIGVVGLGLLGVLARRKK